MGEDPLESVQLLGGEVLGISKSGNRLFTHQIAPSAAIALLAIQPNEVVSYQKLARWLGSYESEATSGVSDSLARCISRARGAFHAEIQSVRKRGYRLVLDPDRVDALEFMVVARLVEAGEDAPGAIEHALKTWRGGVAPFLLQPPVAEAFQPLHDAYLFLSGRRRKRVLIVDDRVAGRIAKLLTDCTCEVSDSLGDYMAQFAHRVDEFDLVLVDLHLSDSYMDNEGEQIMYHIVRSGSSVPVLGMTARADGSNAASAYDLLSKHELADFVFKRGDGYDSDFTPLLDKVRETLAAGEDPQIRRLMSRVPYLAKKAQLRAKMGRDSDAVAAIGRQATALMARQLDDPPLSLGQLRILVEDFRRRWGVEFDPAWVRP